MSNLEGYGKIYESTWWGVGRDNNISWGDVYATLGGAALLDTYTGAIGAYSLRKLSSSYSGDAIVVTTDGVDSQTIGLLFCVIVVPLETILGIFAKVLCVKFLLLPL